MALAGAAEAGAVADPVEAGRAAADVASGGAETTGARCRTSVGPEDTPDEAELAVEVDEPDDAPVEVELWVESGDEGVPRLGPEELAGLTPSAPISTGGAD